MKMIRQVNTNICTRKRVGVTHIPAAQGVDTGCPVWLRADIQMHPCRVIK